MSAAGLDGIYSALNQIGATLGCHIRVLAGLIKSSRGLDLVLRAGHGLDVRLGISGICWKRLH